MTDYRNKIGRGRDNKIQTGQGLGEKVNLGGGAGSGGGADVGVEASASKPSININKSDVTYQSRVTNDSSVTAVVEASVSILADGRQIFTDSRKETLQANGTMDISGTFDHDQKPGTDIQVCVEATALKQA
jgi:hypothetical protein